MAVHAEAGHAHAISKNSTLAQATNVRSAWLTLFTRSKGSSSAIWKGRGAASRNWSAPLIREATLSKDSRWR
jgi:hypothetical protein